MSELTIERHHVVAFGRNLNMTPQVGEFMLGSTVDADLNFTEPGEYFTDEQLGTSAPKLIEDRFGDSPSKTVGRDRRGAYFYAYEDGNYLDNVDRARQLVDPANPIVEAMRMGMFDACDDFIMAGMLAPARQGKTLENAVAFPAANVLATDAITPGTPQPLNVDKLRRAARLLDNGMVKGKRYWIGGASDKEALLATTAVTSSDFNTVKALVNGEINSFMGFEFKWFPDARTPRNPANSAQRRNIAYVDRAIIYRRRPIVGGENADIVRRPDKKNAWYAYYSFEQAVMRRYDAGVLAVDNV